MLITTLKRALPYLLKAKVSTLIWGLHGVGKSQAIKQYCQENGYKFFDLRLGNVEVGDLLGLADFRVGKDGQKESTKFITPDWLTDLIRYCENNPKSAAIIFLDEINRGRRDVLNAVFQMVLDHKHHNTPFPENLHVVGAANPPNENYIVTDIGDKAFMDRFCHVNLTPSLKEWLDFATTKGFDAGITDFIRDQPGMLQEKLAEFTLDEIKPSRRSWEAVSRLMAIKTPIEILQELCYGLLGHAATTAFMESLKNTEKPFAAEDIADHYNKIKSKVVKFSDNKNGGRIDLLKYSSDNLVTFIKKKDKLSKAQEKNISEYIKDIPADVSFSLCRELYLEECCRPMMDSDDELKKILRRAKTGSAEAK